jgi:hypothetical protein
VPRCGRQTGADDLVVESETLGLGLAHGLPWIVMPLICIAAARARVIPFRLAVTLPVLGGLGPFAATFGFAIADRRRSHAAR